MEQQQDSSAKLVGREVRKFFPGHGHFSGKILSYDKGRGFFQVRYGDGDQEELEIHEVREILVPGSGSAKRPRGRPRKHPLLTTLEPELGEFDPGTRKRQREDEPGSLASKRRALEVDTPEKQDEAMREEKPPVQKLRSSKTTSDEGARVWKGGRVFKPSPHRRKSSLLVYPLRRTPTPMKLGVEGRGSGSEKLGEEKSLTRELNVPPLPACSMSFERVEMEFVAELFSAFTFLRSFSWVVFLSPFTLRDFVSCLTIAEANPLFDQIHLSLMLLLRQHLENLAKDGEESAVNCLKSRDWTLLDAVTWPSYLLAFLLNHDPNIEDLPKLQQAGLLSREYHSLEPGIKIRILTFICDRLLDTEEVRAELEKRTENDPDSEPSDPKTPASKTPGPETRDVTSERRARVRKGGSPNSNSNSNSNSELIDPVVVLPEQQQQQQQQQENSGVDWNTDDCVLCGMDGNLICCDGCPGAYHSRCVGVSRASLPEGEWFCPECVLQRSGADHRSHWKVLRGFEFLGIDTFGRRYLAVCEHLFISESWELDSLQVCYGASEIPGCLQALESSGALPPELRASIITRWSLPDDPNPNPSPKESQSLPDTSCCMVNVAGTEAIQKPSLPEKKNSNLEGVYSYVNHYSWGASAALAASRLSERSKNRKLCVQKAQIFEQLNAFSQAPALFSWPSFKRKNTEAPKDRCGWCFACKNLSRKKGCLLNTAAGKIACGAAVVSGGLRPTRKGWGNLPALASYLLYMEDRLNGLLMGAWEDFEQRKRWRKLVESSQSVKEVRLALAEFGLSLRPAALARNWSLFAEDAPKLVPASTNPAYGYVAPRGRRRKNFPEGEPITCVRWWRGGKSSRKFQDWEVLPTSALRRAARKGGGKRIPELVYSDNSEVPRRTTRCAWQARVKSSFSVSELAIQVRLLDALVRWSDLSVPEEARGMNLICERAIEADNSCKYLVESSRPEDELAELLTPEVTFSAFKFIKSLSGDETQTSEPKARVWLPETQLPLCLVREFEEIRRMHIYEEKRRAQMLEEQRRIQLLEEQRRIQALERARALEEKRRIQMLEEKKRIQALEEKKRTQQQMKLAVNTNTSTSPVPRSSGASRKAAVQAEVSSSNKLKIVLKKLGPAPKKLLSCEQCNLDLVACESVSCEECQGDFHKHCLMSRKKSVEPLCQSCFIVKQSRRSRKAEPKAGSGAGDEPAADKTRVAAKPLQVYSRRRNQFPAPVNGFGGATIARRKRSKRPRNTGVRWKPESKLTLNREKLLFPGEQQQEQHARAPECGICNRAYDSSLFYIGCERCQAWYHGNAVGINDANVDRVREFKCHKCRKKASPLCPYKLQL